MTKVDRAWLKEEYPTFMDEKITEREKILVNMDQAAQNQLAEAKRRQTMQGPLTAFIGKDRIIKGLKKKFLNLGENGQRGSTVF